MVMNQTFDHRQSAAMMLSRPGFDIIMAIARTRQTACATALALRHDAGDTSARDTTANRRALLTGRLASARQNVFRAVRFLELGAFESQESVALGEVVTEINDPFTRAFQSMLKPLELQTAYQADEDTRAGSVME